VQIAFDPLELVLLGDDRPGSRTLELFDALHEPGGEQDTSEARLPARERRADPRGENGRGEPAGGGEEGPPPAVDRPVVADVERRPLGRDPPPHGHREHSERSAPEGHSSDPEREADHREQQEPGQVLPGLGIGRDDAYAMPEAPARGVAIAAGNPLAEDVARTAALEVREPAVDVRGREEDRDADKRDEQRDAERQERHEDGEDDHAHGEAEEEVRELAPGREAHGTKEDVDCAHAYKLRPPDPPRHAADTRIALRLTARRIGRRSR
jgi:hypothetical protein